MPGYEHVTASGHPVLSDFRSDTVTRATPAMREAMASAEVGDDVYGEDPTVNALQDRVAELTGMEAALWMTTATEANFVAIMAHCGRGDEYITGDVYHVYVDEAGGASALGGVVPFPLPTDQRGSLHIDQVLAAIKEDDVHHPITRLLSLENTVHGEVQPVDHLTGVAAAAQNAGLAVHLDGARLFNAGVAAGVPIAGFLDQVDSVQLCMSKGLGAPQGAVLAGSHEMIRTAHRLRKMVGGGVRQVGHLAAAAMHALDNHIERLVDDHAHAQLLAAGLKDAGFDPSQATNMVFVPVNDTLQQPLLDHLARQGMAVGDFQPDLRLVCHLDVDGSDVDLLVRAFASFEG